MSFLIMENMISTVKRNVISQGSRCSSKIRAKNNLWYILPLSLSLSCFFYGFPSKKMYCGHLSLIQKIKKFVHLFLLYSFVFIMQVTIK